MRTEVKDLGKILRQNGNIDHTAHEGLRHGILRSPLWHKTEKAFVEANPLCAACGNPAYKVQAHHIFPFHYVIALGRPDLELDFRNLIALCETEHGHPADNHHLLLGHLDDFKSSNIYVQTDAISTFHNFTAEQLKENKLWIAKCANKLKLLDEMNDREKKELRSLIDKTFPLVQK